MKITLFLACVLMLQCMMFSGEKQKPPMIFTGNSAVDFFTGRDAARITDAPFIKLFDNPDTETETDHKSPWLAGGMSLVLPGAGEFYTHSYIKAGVFFGIEVASIVLGHKYNGKGDDQTDFFQNYADAHYSAYQYAKWTYDNISELNSNLHASDYHPFDPSKPNQPPFANVNWEELHRMERDISAYGYTHPMPYYGEQQYYELIGKYPQFMVGWDNVDPNYLNDPVTSGDLPITDHTLPVPGSGLSQAAWYFDQRALANRYYDIGGTYYNIIVLNHIISALDAYWSATRYNSSFHAGAELEMLPTRDGMVAVPEVNLRYDF